MEATAPAIGSCGPTRTCPSRCAKAGSPSTTTASTGAETREVNEWIATHSESLSAIICAPGTSSPDFSGSGRIRSLTPAQAKGLEFDLVVLVDPGSVGSGVTGAVDRYVAMTRATQQLVVLRS
ncbi:ATP-binding domain-containing protein [Dietzia sp. SL131]|nr:ATP-binding domain-containing protein [Dietzia sp. 111N12-1]MCY1657421.1 ATP-binding domain-containing protein [Dietzia sp. SL131]